MSKKFSGKINVKGYVEIINGEYKQTIKNHFVSNLLYTMINWFAIENNLIPNGYSPSYAWTTLGGYIVLGTNTTTATTFGTSGLISPIGASPGTKANSQMASNQQLSNGALVTYSSVWNASTVTGTVGELGLYLWIPTTLVSFNGSYPATGSNFASRLSVADGDFTAFTINTSFPLTANWVIQFTFA